MSSIWRKAIILQMLIVVAALRLALEVGQKGSVHKKLEAERGLITSRSLD